MCLEPEETELSLLSGCLWGEASPRKARCILPAELSWRGRPPCTPQENPLYQAPFMAARCWKTKVPFPYIETGVAHPAESLVVVIFTNRTAPGMQPASNMD